MSRAPSERYFGPQLHTAKLDMQHKLYGSAVRCREITEADIAGVIDLLVRGFVRVSRDSWRRTLERMRQHGGVAGYPPLGYLLEYDGSIVGVVLLIFATVEQNGETCVRCSGSSWCVEPEFRPYASMLVSQALKRREVTYINATPARHTFPIIEAQGYRRYSSGRFVSILALHRAPTGCSVKTFTPCMQLGEDLTAFEVALLVQHQRMGCLSLVCTINGHRSPFVFLPRRKRRIIPYVTLIFCRSIEDFVRCAGPLGRALLVQGFAITTINADGPIPGLKGRFMQGKPIYFRGPNPPRCGDLAYSELVIGDPG